MKEILADAAAWRPQRRGAAASLLAAMALTWHGPVHAATARADFAGLRPSPEVRELADWVVRSTDNRAMPFALVDKKQATLYVFNRQGRLQGRSPVLLGAAKGDDSVPGIGERPMKQIRPSERTTPAGRFPTERGRNNQGEDIVWVDYDAAISMHRVRANNPAEKRLQRLASATPADNRISYGCINVPAPFFNQRIAPAFVGRKGVVYVLPETRSLQSAFGPQVRATSGAAKSSQAKAAPMKR